MDRRRLLGATGTALSTAVAGCAGLLSRDDGDETEPEPTETEPIEGIGDAWPTHGYVAASSRETAAAVDLADESTLWERSLERPARMGPTAVDGAVYLTTEGSVDESGGTRLRASAPA